MSLVAVCVVANAAVIGAHHSVLGIPMHMQKGLWQPCWHNKIVMPAGS